MKSFSFAKALLAVSMLCVSLPVACGDSEDNPVPNPNVGGENGEGGSGATSNGGDPSVDPQGGSEAMGGAPMLPPGVSTTPSTIECGGDCDSVLVGISPTMGYHLDPCCAEGDVCGINTSFLAVTGAQFEESCQPKDQPGEVDEACPSPDPAMVPVMGQPITLDAFPGCCRPSGVCGVVVSEVSTGMGFLKLGNLELGCVDAAPFFPGEDPVPCGEGAGGSGAGGSGAGGGGSTEPVGGGGAGG